MPTPPTIRQALDVSRRSVSSRDAEVFLQTVLQVERSYLHTHPETTLTDAQAAQYEAFLDRREANEPVAYIIGQKEFYGRPFTCDKRALIPRPETEALIDLSLYALSNRQNLQILELGTGVGNIAVTLSLELAARHIPNTIIATDIGKEALELATENQKKLAATSITFIAADLFNHPQIQQTAPYDLIIANLPYVPDTWKTDPEAQPEVVFQEPDLALFGGPDGLDIYRRFFEEAPTHLKTDGLLIVEYNETQTEAIQKLAAQAFPGRRIKTHQDYAGLDRVLEVCL